MQITDLSALLRGYIRFRVNGRRFWTYGAADRAARALPPGSSVRFDGLSIWCGWRVFFVRVVPTITMYQPTGYVQKPGSPSLWDWDAQI